MNKQVLTKNIKSYNQVWIILLVSLFGNLIHNTLVATAFYSLLVISYCIVWIIKRNTYSNLQVYMTNLWLLIILNLIVFLNYPTRISQTLKELYPLAANVMIVLLALVMFICRKQKYVARLGRIQSTSLKQDIAITTSELLSVSKYFIFVVFAICSLFFGIKIIEMMPFEVSIIAIIVGVVFIIISDRRYKQHAKDYYIRYKYVSVILLYQMVFFIITLIPYLFFSILIFSTIFDIL